MESLVVYYSRTGNARFVAQTIAAEVGADIEEVIDLKKRSCALGYLSGGSDARRGKETEIAPTTKSPANYEKIIVGTTVWAGRPTPAITTYIKKNNLSEKKKLHFSSLRSKKSSSIEETKALMPNSDCIGQFSLVSPLSSKEESEKQITEWCKTLFTT